MLPAAITVGLDLARRADRFALMDRAHLLGYAATALTSLVGWGALLLVAARRTRLRSAGAIAFAATFTLSSLVQDAFFARYNVYLALDAQLDAESVPWALVGSLPLTGDLWAYGAGWLATACLCIAIARRSARRAPLSSPVAMALLVGPFVLLTMIPTSYRGVMSSTPDVLYGDALRESITLRLRHALGGAPRTARFQRRDPTPVPQTAPRLEAPRNLLVIMQEAVRADVACPTPGAPCDAPSAPSHTVTPGRIPLRELRAISSSTAIALATTWSGLAPTAPRDLLFSAPLVWEYAASAGYRTGYWTSQHPMFANTRLLVQGAPRDRCVWATQLDPMADYLIGAHDELVSERALSDLDLLGEPFFGVVHYSNVHMPRRIDPARAPFQPTDLAYRRSSDERQTNYYKNAVYLSELAVADLVAGVRAKSYGARTIIVYLSDHGEAWFEHGQDNDHGSTLFDEEIRIQAWIDAPPQTLSATERAHLERASHARVFQTAIAPTLLDLLGVWDAPALASLTQRMHSQPLTRSAESGLEVLTNVSWAWEYGDPNWALMRGGLKLLARSNDDGYHCFDTSRDPGELHDLGPAACGDLRARADDVFGMLPRDLGRLRAHPTWGWTR